MGAVSKFKPRYRAENAALGLQNWERVPAAAAEWVNALRKRGYGAVETMGLPTQKLERWKYTNLPAKLKKLELSHTDAQIELSGMTDYGFSFLKGLLHFPEWAREMVESAVPSQDKYGDMALWYLGNAYFKDGVIIDIPSTTKVGTALNITHTAREGQFVSPRKIIRAQAWSEINIIEYMSGNGAFWANHVSQIKIEAGAHVRHYIFQENPSDAVITQNTHVEIETGGTYEAFVVNNGAALNRHQIHADLCGKDAVCRLDGVNLMDGARQGDTTITVDHRAPNCESYQDYRSVATDKATSTFQGKVHVHQIAQKTDGFQMAKSLLLSTQATINTKPELEIYADDVKCSHGATTGRLDADALFYLRARGIPEAQAKSLLIQAFVNEVVENISLDEAKQQADLIVTNWLKGQLSNPLSPSGGEGKGEGEKVREGHE